VRSPQARGDIGTGVTRVPTRAYKHRPPCRRPETGADAPRCDLKLSPSPGVEPMEVRRVLCQGYRPTRSSAAIKWPRGPRARHLNGLCPHQCNDGVAGPRQVLIIMCSDQDHWPAQTREQGDLHRRVSVPGAGPGHWTGQAIVSGGDNGNAVEPVRRAATSADVPTAGPSARPTLHGVIWS